MTDRSADAAPFPAPPGDGAASRSPHRPIAVVVRANPLKLIVFTTIIALATALPVAGLLGAPPGVTAVITLTVLSIVLLGNYLLGVRRLLGRIRTIDNTAPETWVPDAVAGRITVEMVLVAIALRRWEVLTAISDRLIADSGPGPLFDLHQPSLPGKPLPPPLDVRIEPTQLTPLLKSLDGDNPDPEDTATRVRAAIDLVTSFYGDSRVNRIIVLVLVGFGFLSLGFAGYRALLQVLAGGVPDIVWHLGLGAGIAFVLMLPASLYPQQWLLVSGGTFVRTSSWRRSVWTLERFTPDDSVIVYWRNLNLIVLRRRDGASFSRPITPREFEMLSQAWRSALEAPPIEQLSDWGEGTNEKVTT